MCRVGRLRLVCDMASDLKFALRQSPLLNLLHPLRVNTATRAATDPNAATDLAYYVALNCEMFIHSNQSPHSSSCSPARSLEVVGGHRAHPSWGGQVMSCRAVQGGDRMESAGRRQGDRAGNAENTGARLVPLCAPVLFTSQDVIHDIRLYLPTHPTSPLPHDRFGVVTPVNNRHHPAGVVTSVITLPSLVRGARLDGAVEAQCRRRAWHQPQPESRTSPCTQTV